MAPRYVIGRLDRFDKPISCAMNINIPAQIKLLLFLLLPKISYALLRISVMVGVCALPAGTTS